jgi:hypothetical protein
MKPQSPDDHESGILLTLQPGSYTVIESGKNGTSGVGLIELYDLDAVANAHLSNISTPGVIQTGANVMIGGFISAEPTALLILSCVLSAHRWLNSASRTHWRIRAWDCMTVTER